MFKKKLLLILLLATVLIYSGAVYWSIQDYEEWKQAKLERFSPEIRHQVTIDPYMLDGRGILMIVLGAIIGLVWLIVLFMKKKTKFRIATLATVIIAGVAFPLAYVAYRIFVYEPFYLFSPKINIVYGNPDFIVSTVYWEFTKLVWLGLGIFWLAVAAVRVLRPRLPSDQ